MHAQVGCADCHVAGKRYREAPKECVACHKNEEPHEGKLGRECGSCHDVVAWRHVSYDHDKTAFPLHDRHASVPCAACHFGNRYRDTPKDCAACHEPDDVHHGERGPKCGECHVTKSWKNSKFDHKKETGFALEGVHDRIACNDCHRSGNLKDKLPRECPAATRGRIRMPGASGASAANATATRSGSRPALTTRATPRGRSRADIRK